MRPLSASPISSLLSVLPTSTSSCVHNTISRAQVCYVFTGQGSQYPGVGQSLLRFPVYREAVTAVDKQFKVR